MLKSSSNVVEDDGDCSSSTASDDEGIILLLSSLLLTRIRRSLSSVLTTIIMMTAVPCCGWLRFILLSLQRIITMKDSSDHFVSRRKPIILSTTTTTTTSSSSSRRLLSPVFTVTVRKIVLLVFWVALSMPCFAVDNSGLLITVDSTTASGTPSNEQQLPPISSTTTNGGGGPIHHHRPYLVICTVDGNIVVLNARDGDVVSIFNSGIPLVGPSDPIAGQDRRIVPGLDGRLYVSSDDDDGLLEPLEITVLDVLSDPVKTCKSASPSFSDESEHETTTTTTTTATATDEIECGIVTATKSTSLFALDPTTGTLIWQQHPNGTTTSVPPPDVEGRKPVTHTVLLQREDVLVQQISTATGRSVWNITLGSLQALEFESDSGPTTAQSTSASDSADLPPSNHGLLLGTGRRKDRAENLLLEVYLADLPHVIFSEDGMNIVAVDPSTSFTSKRRHLWSRDFPTIVASVFGLNGRSWEPLTVLEEGSLYDNDDGVGGDDMADGVGGRRRVLPPDPTTSTLAVYRSPHVHVFDRYNVERLYRGMNWLMRSTGWKNQDRNYQRPALPVLPQHEMDYQHHQPHREKKTTMGIRDNNKFYHVGQYQPRLALPSPDYVVNQSHGRSGGLFLTWPFLVAIVCCFCLGALLGFRYLYMKKKKEWLGLLRAAITSEGRSVSFQHNVVVHDDSIIYRTRSGSDGSNGEQVVSDRQTNHTKQQRLARSQSMPEKLDQLLHNSNNNRPRKMSIPENIPHHDGMAPLGVVPNTNGNEEQNGGSPHAILDKPMYMTTRSTTTSSATEIPLSSRGVGLIDGSIPLIQYSRYASEFEELGALGKGGFGSVFQCRNALDGREYAIKKVHIRSDSNLPQAEFSRRLQRTLREVKSLALLDHPNIVRYYTAWLEQEQKDDGHDADESYSVPPDSEYDLFTPTASRVETVGRGGIWKINDGTSRHRLGQGRSVSPGARKRPNLDHKNWRGGHQNQIGYGESSSGVDESQASVGCYGNGIFGVPDALDDYGFVFDRGDDDGEDADEGSGDGMDGGNAGTEVTKSVSARHSKGGGSSSHGRHRGISFQTSHSCADESSTGWSRESRNQSDGTREETRGHSIKKKSSKHGPSTTTRYILYIQMQFCSQKTLANFLSNEEARKGPSGSITGVDIPYALNLFLQVGQGVKHVHNQGLIHRDLKPTNCFVDDAGVVKVGDFGLSRESSDTGRSEGEPVVASSTVFENGDITAGVGTRSYASPEQMKGGSEYDSSTDIYSLGIILFELCYPMYTGMERNIVLSNLRNHIFPDHWMKSVVPEFPTLHSLLLSMISNQPGSRPTAASVVQTIQSILDGFTISSLDKHHYKDCILLRVETRPREDVLRHTMQLVVDAALPNKVEIVQYGLRGGTNKAIMEFAIRHDFGVVSSENGGGETHDRPSGGCLPPQLGNLLVNRLSDDPEVILIRQVSATAYA